MPTSRTESPASDLEPDSAVGVADLQADIERQRDSLAETVDALAAKLDVKSRAKQRFHDATRQVRSRAAADWRTIRAQTVDDNGRPTSVAIAVSIAVAVIGLGLWWRQSHQ